MNTPDQAIDHELPVIELSATSPTRFELPACRIDILYNSDGRAYAVVETFN